MTFDVTVTWLISGSDCHVIILGGKMKVGGRGEPKTNETPPKASLLGGTHDTPGFRLGLKAWLQVELVIGSSRGFRRECGLDHDAT